MRYSLWSVTNLEPFFFLRKKFQGGLTFFTEKWTGNFLSGDACVNFFEISTFKLFHRNRGYAQKRWERFGEKFLKCSNMFWACFERFGWDFIFQSRPKKSEEHYFSVLYWWCKQRTFYNLWFQTFPQFKVIKLLNKELSFSYLEQKAK